MTAYYNEIDTAAVHVLRCLIADGIIAPGVVDARSIKDVTANDLRGFTQCHFFAGGGLWSIAARLAGWPDDRPLWTASCPCQPFSRAGKGAGIDDPRHLWPDVDRLIDGCTRAGYGPLVVLGEQVAGKAGYNWFNGVRTDLAGQGYRTRVVDIPACAVDAPNIRQRLYWCALANSESLNGRARPGKQSYGSEFANGDGPGNLGGPFQSRLEGYGRHVDGAPGRQDQDRPTPAPDDGHMGSAASDGREQGQPAASIDGHRDQPAATHGCNGSFWSDHEWIICHDGKARRAKSGVRDVAHGISAGMDSLCRSRGYSDQEIEAVAKVMSPGLLVDGIKGRIDLWKVAGNAINAQLAAAVLGAVMEVFP